MITLWFNAVAGKCYKITFKDGKEYHFGDGSAPSDFEGVDLSDSKVEEVACEDVKKLGWKH